MCKELTCSRYEQKLCKETAVCRNSALLLQKVGNWRKKGRNGGISGRVTLVRLIIGH